MKEMNKIFPKIILICLILIISQACIDLEEDTSSILLIEELRSEDEINAALAPVYRRYLDMILAPHAYAIVGYGSDDITTWWAGNKASYRVFDRFDYGNGENAGIDGLNDPWDASWKVIYFANTLIDGLKTSSADEEVVKIADGEARFFRALAYMYLVRGWGNVPVILDGVIPTGEETRATVLDNYIVIEADLKIAETTLPGPGKVSNVGRASSAAAKALLADLYLTWSGWPVKDESKYSLAANKAREIIDMNYFKLLPIHELWLLKNQNSLESLFAIQFSKSENIISKWPRSNSFHESMGFSDMYPERQFFYDFPEGARKNATFGTEIPQRKVVNGIIVDNVPPTKIWQKSQRNHPMYKKFTISEDLTVDVRTSGFRAVEIYRYAEILLIYAEASARANGGIATGAALEAFNKVRRRAAGLPFDQSNPSVDVTSITADEIVKEKGWELAGELIKRWHDLVRLEKVTDAVSRRDPTEEVPLAKEASAITWKQYIAPIPFKTISTGKLIQNPEGFKAQ